MPSRQLRDWALLGSAANSAVTLRVFDTSGALRGAFTVTPGTTSKLIENCTWGGSGWSDDFASAEVISVANGSVYAAPVKDAAVLTSVSGTALVPNFDLGDLPLGDASNPKPGL